MPAGDGEVGFAAESIRKEPKISTLSPSSNPIQNRRAGSHPGPGTYFCVECGSHLALTENDALPDCPACGGTEFRLDSIFEGMQEGSPHTVEFASLRGSVAPQPASRLRSLLPGPGRFLAVLDEDGSAQLHELSDGWTRIGRSAAADLRLDDPSVSRRHALVVSEAGRPLRILDDRSLNGVFVNGRRTEWDRLEDGDELGVGRFRLFVLEA